LEITIFLLIFSIWFSGSFFGILAFLLWLSHYSKLYNDYAIESTFPHLMEDTTLKIGFVSFKNNIQLAMTNDGIYLALKQPYKLLAPHTLFIPWVDIKVTEISENSKIPQISMQLGPNNVLMVLYDEKYFHKLWQLTSYLATLERTDFAAIYE